MNFIEGLSFTVAEVYLGFFAASFLILGLILLSGVPAGLKRLFHEVRLFQARQTRSLRTLADPEQLDRAGRRLEGVTLFAGDRPALNGSREGGPGRDQEVDEPASELNSDAA